MLDGDQVVRAAPASQVFGVGALGMQGVGGDHGPGQVDAVQQGGEHRDLIRLRRNIDLPQDHAADVIEGGQQMPGRLPACAGPAQRLAVDRDHPPRAGRRDGALLGPGPRRRPRHPGHQRPGAAASAGTWTRRAPRR